MFYKFFESMGLKILFVLSMLATGAMVLSGLYGRGRSRGRLEKHNENLQRKQHEIAVAKDIRNRFGSRYVNQKEFDDSIQFKELQKRGVNVIKENFSSPKERAAHDYECKSGVCAKKALSERNFDTGRIMSNQSPFATD